MITDRLTNPTVRATIDALQKSDEKAWFANFTSNAELYDDGNKQEFKKWSSGVIKGREHFTSIDKIEDNGLSIYGKYHSDKWGDFKTYYKFHINSDGKITRLDVGQATY